MSVPTGLVTIRNELENQLAFLPNNTPGIPVLGVDDPPAPRSRWDIHLDESSGHFTIVNDGTGAFAFNQHSWVAGDPVVGNPTPELYAIQPIPNTVDRFTIATTNVPPLFWSLATKFGDVKLDGASSATTWVIVKNSGG